MKLILKFSILIAILTNPLSTFASTIPKIDINSGLKNSAINKFIAEANNPQSPTGLIIAHINYEATDGRNPKGIITLPVKTKDLQVVTLSSEKLLNPWHYASKNDDGTICSGQGDSTEVLILLSNNTFVHMAQDFSVTSFKIESHQEVSAKRKDGKVIEFCSDASNGGNGKFIYSPVKNIVGEIVEIIIGS